MTPFTQAHLRTTNVDAARSFYRSVLGRDDVQIFALHEQALARGARPHWLSYIYVNDVDAALAAMVQRGGIALGPKWQNGEGLEAANVRDPGGAVLSLAKAPQRGLTPSGPEITFRVLNTNDIEQAKRTYSELFGWHFHDAVDLRELGLFYPFSAEQAGPVLGAAGDIAGRPGLHPHWLYQFEVADLDAAVERVRGLGGLVAERHTMPSGTRVAICDDAQGAAFALRMEASS